MKNKILLLIALSITLAMNVYSQNSGFSITAETRTSKPYHHLHIKGEMKIKLVQNEIPGLTVEGTAYQIGNTVTMLSNDTLFIYQTNIRKGDCRTFLRINVNDLVSLEVSGKTRVNCKGLATADHLTIKADAGAKVKLDVRALKADTKTADRSYTDLSGSVSSDTANMDSIHY